MDYLAIDPGTHKTGVALFVDDHLHAWWLINPSGDVEQRIAAIISELDSILEQHGHNVRQVACERNKGIERRFPAPELQTLINRLRRWATSGKMKGKGKFAWYEYSSRNAMGSVRPTGATGVSKRITQVGVALLYEGAPLGWQGNLAVSQLPEDVIDAIAIGHCHKVKQELVDELYL